MKCPIQGAGYNLWDGKTPISKTGDVRSQRLGRGKVRTQQKDSETSDLRKEEKTVLKKSIGDKGLAIFRGNPGPTLVARGGSGPRPKVDRDDRPGAQTPRGGSHGRLSLMVLMVLKEEHPVTKRWDRGKWGGEGPSSTWINPVNYLHVFANRTKLNHGTCRACSGVSHLQ